ncbi:hypothetical protein JTE90_025498 [Oedothorax gibbosus]|uniref:Uncharacterized protein n=1 Tax=Oedothorax gibbosus TaxID=931172 RepID=A0AAV6UXN0_9ARAC|nr:hypothetical protein JTE90_025498 [Oedothorax gibbosus]
MKKGSNQENNNKKPLKKEVTGHKRARVERPSWEEKALPPSSTESPDETIVQPDVRRMANVPFPITGKFQKKIKAF